MRLLTAVFVSGILSAGAAYTQQLQDIEPTYVDSKKCYNGGDRGCTADRVQCVRAPNNYMFVESTLRAVPLDGAGNGSKWCKISSMDKERVVIKSDQGFDVNLDAIKRVCLNAHAESGSGVRNAFTTAWQNCELHGKIQQFRN